MGDKTFPQPKPQTNLCGSAITQALQYLGTARLEQIQGWLEANQWSAHPNEVQSLLWAEIRAGRIESVEGWYALINGAPMRLILAPEERTMLERATSSLEALAISMQTTAELIDEHVHRPAVVLAEGGSR